MEKPAHSPLPWSRNGVRTKLGREDCVTIGPEGGNWIVALPIGSTGPDHAGALNDADLIVKAVNCHDDLVKALTIQQAFLTALVDQLDIDENDTQLNVSIKPSGEFIAGITLARGIEMVRAALAKAGA